QAGRRDFAALAATIARVAEALPSLDFGLLQQKGGLLARLSGKGRNTVTGFAAQFDAIEAVAAALAEQAKALQGKQGDQASRTDLTVLEIDLDLRAIEKCITTGDRVLHELT